jgi:hypothetical protein
MWTSLESLMLSRALDTHAQLQKPKDREWIHILISFLKAYVEELGKELLMHADDKKEYVSQLVKELHIAAKELDAGNAHGPFWTLVLKSCYCQTCLIPIIPPCQYVFRARHRLPMLKMVPSWM